MLKSNDIVEHSEAEWKQRCQTQREDCRARQPVGPAKVEPQRNEEDPGYEADYNRNDDSKWTRTGERVVIDCKCPKAGGFASVEGEEGVLPNRKDYREQAYQHEDTEEVRLRRHMVGMRPNIWPFTRHTQRDEWARQW